MEDDDNGAPGTPKGLDEPSMQPTSLETLEKDFQEVLTELVGDKSLERFRLEYEKLHRALKKSNLQEKKLIKKCRELNGEIVNNAAKVQTALKLSQEDQATIASLKKEMEKAWKMVDASHEKEIRAKETITQLKDEITNLSRLVEQGAGLSIGQENMMKELVKAKEELSRSNEEHENNAKKDHQRMQELHARIAELEETKKQHTIEIQSLRDKIILKTNEQERENRRKERLDKEIKDVKLKLEKKTIESTALTTDMTRTQSQLQNLEKQLSDSQAAMEKYVRDYETLYNRSQKLTDMLNEQNDKAAQLEINRREIENELKAKEDEITKLKLEKGMAERKIDKEKRNAQKIEEKLESERTAKIVLQTQIKSMQKDLDTDKKIEDAQKAELEMLERERGIQIKNVQKAEEKIKKVIDEVKTNERVAKNLESELNGYKNEAAKQRKLIYQLEKEREKYGIEASEQRNLYLQAQEDIKLKDMRIYEMQKKVTEGEVKLKQQQQLYEAVRSDRNLYSKNLIESQDEIAEMKRKFKIINHQIEQLKEEVSAKDHALVKEHFDHQKVEKQREQHKNELARLRTLLTTNEETINNQDAEIRKLTTMIRRMDEEALEQKKEYDQVINERDILGTQLIRRNDELALLYEKLKIQQSTLSKGETQYQERMADIRVLKLKITDMKRELHIAKHQVGQLDDLKREVYHLQRELLQEKTKVKALSEELENPMNVHRWRKLEGSDPATYEMIQKIQTLQKRLIQKTEEVVEKDLIILEKDKLYVELKNILARQPGPEVAEQLSVYQQTLRDKDKQLKALLSEQNMFQSKENELKFEIERLARELHDVKRKYYKKKLEDKLQDVPGLPTIPKQPPNQQPVVPEKARHLSEQQKQLAITSSKRYIGGGIAEMVGAGLAVEWKTDDVHRHGYLVYPEDHVGRIMTGVVLVPDAAGGASFHVRTFADKLAEQGYKVLVPDTLYGPISPVDEIKHTASFNAWRSASRELRDEMITIVQSARDVLRKYHEVARVGVLGLGFGCEIALELAAHGSDVFDAAVLFCPTALPTETLSIPTLIVIGDKNEYVDLKQIRDFSTKENVDKNLRVKIMKKQAHGFCFSHVVDEDASTQAIAELLDWFVFYLHRFRMAAGTSDGDPWWPQGRNGPFFNVGLATWQQNRAQWTSPIVPRPPRRPPVDSSLILEGLASLRRTYDLPHPMNLGDIISLYVDVWDVNQ